MVVAYRIGGSTSRKPDAYKLQAVGWMRRHGSGGGERTAPDERREATAPGPDPSWPGQSLDPRRDCAMTPYRDEDTVVLVEEAATSLILLRAPMWLGDAGPMISVLASLSNQAQDHLIDAVALARHQDYTWEDIAGRLGTTAISARRRYARARADLSLHGD
jgi:DNA-directed RNA polymerase specialized sigma24 family protein